MNTQFKKGVIELCILKVVSRKDMYGFEIIDQLSDLLDVNENTIYPILRRLTEQELFSIYTKETSLGAPRKYYTLTKKGKETLDEYLNEWEGFIENVMKILKEKENE
ncbi:PadR family transcriptional regulator [Acholeplasma hippikon]|uniref:Threonine synthase n=1 Tax=Acholeplasma hippikon TaxID=264636 RepID=A0A449BK44_9MOLU|nr:PadR family transcriptional regulator [Acholeplasma hippikon]VEU82845.1 threonine synthase [Acholeplasma hippikon]